MHQMAVYSKCLSVLGVRADQPSVYVPKGSKTFPRCNNSFLQHLCSSGSFSFPQCFNLRCLAIVFLPQIFSFLGNQVVVSFPRQPLTRDSELSYLTSLVIFGVAADPRHSDPASHYLTNHSSIARSSPALHEGRDTHLPSQIQMYKIREGSDNSVSDSDNQAINITRPACQGGSLTLRVLTCGREKKKQTGLSV